MLNVGPPPERLILALMGGPPVLHPDSSTYMDWLLWAGPAGRQDWWPEHGVEGPGSRRTGKKPVALWLMVPIRFGFR